jgi:SNF2 family DNA or RNA helicase
MGMALGRTFTGFRSAYFESDYMGFKWDPRPGTPERIQEALKPLSIAMRTEDYLSLPPKIERQHTVTLSSQAMTFYKTFEKECFAEIDGHELTALSAGVLAGKLQQAAQGAIYNDDGVVLEIHTAKIDALEELIEAAQEPVMVVYTYKHDLSRIKSRVKNAFDVREPGAIDGWNAGRVPVLCAHPASAGHGLNLQDGGCQMIWFGQTWSGELDEQMVGRLYRQGQTKPVVIHRLIAEGTIDEQIVMALADKSSGQNALINAIKTISDKII